MKPSQATQVTSQDCARSATFSTKYQQYTEPQENQTYMQEALIDILLPMY